MSQYNKFKEIVEVFHSQNVIENSKGKPSYKIDVQASRANAENEARLLIMRRWHQWDRSVFIRVIENVNVNGFPSGLRFSRKFEDNLDNIAKVGIENTREAVVELLDEEKTLEERLKGFRQNYGTDAKGLFSSILYVYDPDMFTPLMKGIVRNLNLYELNKGTPARYSITGYFHYCDCMKTLEQDFKLTPQLSDYVLTTWMSIWGKFKM